MNYITLSEFPRFHPRITQAPTRTRRPASNESSVAVCPVTTGSERTFISGLNMLNVL
ncbi:hypothetical protein P691DRAFT_807447 [Macrolepiota fuliginosa MF-IS2]|uniref:Uncharacterized protein n=1 Tax=Macrolepiota fuliginosa MF-IS2 TaxID=1400762 RepID=A0A9P5XHN1_9AGAR|nr:hypothetical protein P691DRAFT_807447 [Macrolepiota fuliginosa MF-IS2]